MPLKRSFQEALYCSEMGWCSVVVTTVFVLPSVRIVARVEAGPVLTIALPFVG